MAKVKVVPGDKLCNDCGNCAVCGPYASAPYKDKCTVLAGREDRADSENPGFCVLDKAAGSVRIRMGGQEYDTVLAADTRTHASIKALIETVIRDYAYCL